MKFERYPVDARETKNGALAPAGGRDQDRGVRHDSGKIGARVMKWTAVLGTVCLVPGILAAGSAMLDFEADGWNPATLSPMEASASVTEKSVTVQTAGALSGRRCLALTVSIAKEGYIQIPVSKALAAEVLSRMPAAGTLTLPLSMEGDEGLKAFVQIVDAKGERFQKILPRTGAGWGRVEIPLTPAGFPEKWGGDGVLDLPLKTVYLGVRGTGNGTLRMDDLGFPTAGGPTVFSFESGEGWNHPAIGKGVGAKFTAESLTVTEGEKGSKSLAFTATLEAGGYVQYPVSKAFPKGLLEGIKAETALTFSMKQNGDLRLFVQVIDASGETFQVLLPPAPADEWKKIRLPLVPATFPDIWAGDKDRQITRPLREIRMGLRGAGTGTIWLGDLAFRGEGE